MINHKQFQLIQIKFIKLNWGKSEPEKQNINCVTPITQSLYGTMFCFSCVDWVLIVEKETVFQSIIQTNFAEKYRCLIVTASRQTTQPIVWNNVDSKLICEFYAIYFLLQGKGQPCFPTRHFLHSLYINFPGLPFYGLFDSDSWGLAIYHTYKFGSQVSIFEQ